MKQYTIMQMPGHKARSRAARNTFAGYADSKNRGEVEAADGETALRIFAKDKLGDNYTCLEFRPEARYAPAFLVARCWNGNRNNHQVRFEAWRKDR